MSGSTDWFAGYVLPTKSLLPLRRTEIVRFQGASGDFDAAHHDDAHARSYGFRGVFSLGMMHAGQLCAYLSELAPVENVRRFKARFRSVVYPGDALVCSGVVESVEHDDKGPFATLTLKCEREGGDAVIDATATVRLTP